MTSSDEGAGWRGGLRRIGRFSSRSSAAIVVLSSIGLLWAQVHSHIQTDRQRSEAAALANASNLARALEQHMMRELGAMDQTLLYVRDMFLRNPETFRLDDLQKKGQFLSQIAAQVAMTDDKGFLMTSNLIMTKAIDLSDREHIRVHLDGRDDKLFVSKPVKGRLSGKWVMQLSRRMEFPDGRLAGVVVASAELAPLAAFHSSVRLGEGGTITIIGDDGVVRLRSPHQETYLGQEIALPDGRPTEAPLSEGSYFRRVSQFDQIERLYWSRRIEGYPLKVVIGQSTEDVFREANADAFEQVVTGVISTLWLLGLLVMILRYQRGLATARDKAEAGTRSKSQFLTTMSHEIRTPLNGVIGLADVLASTSLNAEQSHLLRTLRSSATHLLGLLNDVLDLSRLEANKMQIENVHFSLRDVAQSVIDLLQPNASEKGLKLLLDIAPEVWSAHRGDPARIRQILLNLIGNGIKFTESGFVRLNIMCGPKGEEALEQRLDLIVEDTGRGIPPQATRSLFAEFSQVDASIARRHGGTGLGLAITQRLVHRMGGEISVRSEVDIGSWFIVRLTLAEGDPREIVRFTVDGDAREQQRPKGTYRILLAEDNLTNRFAISRQLALLGQEVEVVGSGAEAVEAVATKEYDLVFMDVMMPVMDGLEATRRIRAMPGARARVRILALSANISEADQGICLDAGMNGFVSKPVTREQLIRAIDQVMGDRMVQAIETPVAAEAGNPMASRPELPPRLVELWEQLGPDDAQMVAGLFLEESLNQIAQLRDALAQNDRQTLKRLAHSIKGAAAGLGFDDLAQEAKTLEIEALQADSARIGAQLERLTEQRLAAQELITGAAIAA